MGTKYTKHGVKRQHHIIEGILPLLEKISEIDGVKKVNPGKISYSPKRRISQPAVKIQRRTATGFKLLAHSKGAVQEIFIIVQNGKADDVQKELMSRTTPNVAYAQSALDIVLIRNE